MGRCMLSPTPAVTAATRAIRTIASVRTRPCRTATTMMTSRSVVRFASLDQPASARCPLAFAEPHNEISKCDVLCISWTAPWLFTLVKQERSTAPSLSFGYLRRARPSRPVVTARESAATVTVRPLKTTTQSAMATCCLPGAARRAHYVRCSDCCARLCSSSLSGCVAYSDGLMGFE